MDEYESLSHTKWDRKYHVIFIPKYGAGRCTGSCASIWEKCFANWPSRRRAKSRKGI
jgi:putative transposase